MADKLLYGPTAIYEKLQTMSHDMKVLVRRILINNNIYDAQEYLILTITPVTNGIAIAVVHSTEHIHHRIIIDLKLKTTIIESYR